jgi:hypothetical protein
LTARVRISAGPDSETVIRITHPLLRRIATGTLFGLVGIAFFAFKVGLRPTGSWGSPWAIVAVGALAWALVALIPRGETIRIWDGLVTISAPLSRFELSREDQPIPQYAYVPRKIWGAQRYTGERGSGVLMLGVGADEIRFGDGLTETEALTVIQGFRTHDGSKRGIEQSARR